MPSSPSSRTARYAIAMAVSVGTVLFLLFGIGGETVFAAVAREVAQVLKLPLVEMSRFDPDGAMTVIGAWFSAMYTSSYQFFVSLKPS